MASIGQRLIESKDDWIIAIQRYRKAHGKFPRLLRPKTLNDKILHRILFDRRDFLTETTCKYRVRDFVERRGCAHLLAKNLYVTDRPETIPFDDLPSRFVVKPTHASGWFQIVHDKASLDRKALIEKCHMWLKQSFYMETREWAYKHIVPRIFVQEYIDDGTGPRPRDYRIYTFGGKPEFLIVDCSQSGQDRSRFLTLSWEPMAVYNGRPDIVGDVPRPKHFDEMIAAAEILSRGTDFVRVDFFDTDEKLYFAELTSTPNCGLKPIVPLTFDQYLGDLWKL